MSRPPPPVCLDARALLEIDLQGLRLIEASAGTGKTHTIANLYLRHILEGRLASEILVVTYTNAATDELRDRIHDRLSISLKILKGLADPDDEFLELLLARYRGLASDAQALQLKRIQLALRSMDEARISTIHSFCQRALLDFALEGNQFFESSLVRDDDSIWQQAIKDWWRKNTYHLDPDSWYLISNHADNLKKLLSKQKILREKPAARLLSASDQSLQELLSAWKACCDDIAALRQAWRRNKTELAQILAQSDALSRAKSISYHPDKLPAYIDEMNRFFDSDSDFKLPKKLHYLGRETLRKKSKKSVSDPALEHPFFEMVDAARQHAKQVEKVTSSVGSRMLFEAHHFAIRRVAEIKRQSRSLAYQDLLAQLYAALQTDSGESLCAALRQIHPVAMIDEFQDTDAIQYRIFERLYFDDPSLSLTLIGDPKQAIYSFRGGDIFTYMRARHAPGMRLYSLLTNWRSQPKLVAAVNAIFLRRRAAFIYAESIDFLAASAAGINQGRQLRLAQGETAGLTLWQLEGQAQDSKAPAKIELLDRINQAVADEILKLLNPGSASIGGQPVVSGDIAILVRNAFEGQRIGKLLGRCGIRSVTIGRESVFASDEAGGLLCLLQAVAHQASQSAARRSLASNLLFFDYTQIAAIGDDENAWQDWNEKLYALHQSWSAQGFIAMFQRMLHVFDLGRRLASRENAERRLTNLLHLGELLHQQASRHPGMTSLLAWLQAQLDDSNDEAAELRLESDEALVKIVTIHKSKGLQYPIVFIPFLWTCKPVGKSDPLSFHDAAFDPMLDLGSENFDANRIRSEKERLAEDVRLLYVALTRAQSKAYLVWGQATYSAQTALAWLLHSQQTPEQLDQQTPDGFNGEMDFIADLRQLVLSSDASIETRPLPRDAGPASGYPEESRGKLIEPARFVAQPLNDWRISSFTALTRDLHQVAAGGDNESHGDVILDFPAGSHVGLLLHSLLEHLDFQQDLASQCAILIPQFANRYGLGSENYQRVLIEWMKAMLDTRLNEQGFKLSDLPASRRLNELSFDLAVDYLDVSSLNLVLQRLSETPLTPPGAQNFRGLLTGVIDLVFEFEGRYYLADYKTNHLGSSLDDYVPSKLRQAAYHRRYDLQSLIYVIALHRYLAQRIRGYSYEQHFGGSYYLFLRAMRPDTGPACGVYFERPDEQTIAEVDSILHFSVKSGDDL